jgi:hypothetical protein
MSHERLKGVEAASVSLQDKSFHCPTQEASSYST